MALIAAPAFMYASTLDVFAPDAVYGAAFKAPDYNSGYNSLPGNGTYPRQYIQNGADFFDFAHVDSVLGPPVDGGNTHNSFNSHLIPQFQNKWILINNKFDLYNLSYRMDGRSTAGNFNRNNDARDFYRSAWYMLADNIEYTMASYEGVVPFGSGGSMLYPFTGVFDGQGFNIEGLFLEADGARATLNLSGERYFALFNNNAGDIKNLGIVKPSIDAASYSGGQAATAYAAGLCGYNSGLIQYCFAENAGGTIKGARAAGICVTNAGSSSAGKGIDNVYFAGALAATDGAAFTQPIALANTGTIMNAWYDSTLYSAGSVNYGTGAATAHGKTLSCRNCHRYKS